MFRKEIYYSIIIPDANFKVVISLRSQRYIEQFSLIKQFSLTKQFSLINSL